jgi:hypothetical protein
MRLKPKSGETPLRYTKFGDKIQRWLCRNCGLRFSDPKTFQKSWSSAGKTARTAADNEIKAGDALLGTRQICVGDEKLGCRTTNNEVLRRNEAEVKGKIIEHASGCKKKATPKQP